MSLSGSSRFLDVRKLTTEDIIDLIKNDEYYSSCCKIIEERDLNGQDILNLTEKQILAWRTPQWLIRNLMSLKSSLSKNPEMFLQQEEENISVNLNLRNDFVKNKGAKLPKPPDSKHSFKPKNEEENKYLSFDTRQDEIEPFYDENNYLQPNLFNVSAKTKQGYGKPLPQLPPTTEFNSIKKKDLSRSHSSFRNPIPSPREDIEENVYEPAPHSPTRINTKSPSPFLPPQPVESDNEYEAPPIIPHKLHKTIHQQVPSKFNTENSSVSDKLEKKFTKNEIKRKLSDHFLSPPLPVRTLTLTKNTQREKFTPNRKNSPYTNVTNHRLSDDDNTQKNTPVIDVNETVTRNNQRKYSQSPTKVESNATSSEVWPDQKSRASERPLPPIPVATEKRRNSMSESRKNSKDRNMAQDEKIADEVLKYYSLRQTSFPQEILEKSRNTEESTIPLKSDFIQGLKSKLHQTSGSSPNLSQFEPTTRNNELSKKEYIVNYNSENSRGPHEYNNNDGAMKSSTSNATNEAKLNSNLLSQIFKIKLKSTKYAVQKSSSNKEIDRSNSSNSEEITKPLKSNESSKPAEKPISTRFQVNSQVPQPTQMKFRSQNSTVPSRNIFVRDSAEEDEPPVEYINSQEAKRLEVKQNSESALKIKTHRTNPLIPNVNSNPRKAPVSNEDTSSNEENDENLPEYINTFESTLESKAKYGSQNDINWKRKKIAVPAAEKDEIRSESTNKDRDQNNLVINQASNPMLKRTNQNSNQSLFSHLVAEISMKKLKPTIKTVNKKPIPLDDNSDNDEILPEYSNAEELGISSRSDSIADATLKIPIRNAHMSWQSEHDSKLPEERYKPDDASTGTDESLADDNDDEDLRDYGNREEIIRSTRQFSTSRSVNAPKSHQTTNQSPISQLISDISKVKLKPTNYNLLDDTAAEILKRKLLEKGLTRHENREDQNEGISSQPHAPKPPLKLATPPSVCYSNEYLDDDFEEELPDTDEEYDYLYNLNNEKYFRNTDRKGAKLLLRGLEDGAFVLRPSKEKKFFLSITVKKGNKYYNLGIIQTENQNIFCGEGNMRSPEFPSIKKFLDHFEKVPFVLQGEQGVENVYLKKVLPIDRF